MKILKKSKILSLFLVACLGLSTFTIYSQNICKPDISSFLVAPKKEPSAYSNWICKNFKIFSVLVATVVVSALFLAKRGYDNAYGPDSEYAKEEIFKDIFGMLFGICMLVGLPIFFIVCIVKGGKTGGGASGDCPYCGCCYGCHSRNYCSNSCTYGLGLFSGKNTKKDKHKSFHSSFRKSFYRSAVKKVAKVS